MSTSDYWVKAYVIIGILIYLATFIAGLITHKLPRFVSIVNALSGLAVIIYWGQQQLRITQHTYEGREMVFLGFEVIVVAVAVYSLLSSHTAFRLTILQYLFFSIQFIFLVLLLLFIIFFKMDKMF